MEVTSVNPDQRDRSPDLDVIVRVQGDSGIPAAVDTEHGNCPNRLGHPSSMSHAMTESETDDARN